VQIYDKNIENPPNRESNEVEIDEVNDKPRDRESPQIGSLRDALSAVKCNRKYISSIEIQNVTLFSNTVEL